MVSSYSCTTSGPAVQPTLRKNRIDAEPALALLAKRAPPILQSGSISGTICGAVAVCGTRITCKILPPDCEELLYSTILPRLPGPQANVPCARGKTLFFAVFRSST